MLDQPALTAAMKGQDIVYAIEAAAAKITVQGDRCPKHLEERTGR